VPREVKLKDNWLDKEVSSKINRNFNVYHGYVRASNGAITTFDGPGAGTSAFQGTFGAGINPVGTITGNYIDASNVNHGLVRDKHGGLTTFDAPGAGTVMGQGTFPSMPNPAGAIVGYYLDASNVYHGFLLEGE
jgi:hypothetical protein